MGFFDSIGSGFGSLSPTKLFTGKTGQSASYLTGDPVLSGLSSMIPGETLDYMSDPLDLWGGRAESQREKIRGIQMGAAQKSIAAQEAMLNRLNALYDPYRQASMRSWGDYTSMAAGGAGDAAPMSPQYKMEMARNAKAINRAMAAKGAFGSSGRGAALSDAALQAGQSEAARQYGRQLDMQRMGTGAIEALGGAGRAAGQNVGATYGNLGSALNTMYQQYGQQRQKTADEAANALYGFGTYMAQR